jgi:hypothetical protein
MKAWRIARIAGLAGALVLAVTPASAQRMVEWPARAAAGSEALTTGASAVFWNPALVQPADMRAEATVIDLNLPDETGANALALGGSVWLDERTAVAFGYEHVAVDDIPLTDDSPREGPGAPTFSVGDDVFTAAAARLLSPALRIGAAARYVRPTEGDERDAVIGIGAGAAFQTSLPLAPVIAASVFNEDEATSWFAGVGASSAVAGEDWRIGGSYGLARERGPQGIGHRAALSASWRQLATVSFGADGEDEMNGMQWTPVAALDVRISRYQLGVMRAVMPNDFGAAYAFRLGIGF